MSNNTAGMRNEFQDLIQCPTCLRRMRQDVFVKHPKLCGKNPTNKRHVDTFDMTKYRSVQVGDKIIPVNKIVSNDMNKSDILDSIRPSQTRNCKRDRRSDNTLVPPVINNFCCPICKRTFCEKAYDRHAAFCSNKTKQIPQSPSEEILLARLRLNRRMKFGLNQVAATSTKNSQTKLSFPPRRSCFLSS